MKKCLNEGKKKLKDLNNFKWVLSSAEKLPFKDNSFDYYYKFWNKKCN